MHSFKRILTAENRTCAIRPTAITIGTSLFEESLESLREPEFLSNSSK